MPIFTYRCQVCKDVEDILVSRKDMVEEFECPKCSLGTMKRDTIYSPTVQFVGAGWPGQDMKLQEKLNRGDIASTKP